MAKTFTPTPVESANLILRLYEDRREEKMRKARDFMVGFDPRTVDEYMTELTGPNGVCIRMVLSYWEMAAALVLRGAIDAEMFLDTTAEHVLMFSRIQPILPQLREVLGAPTYLKSLEKLCLSMPDAQQYIDNLRERVRALMARRSAAQQASA